MPPKKLGSVVGKANYKSSRVLDPYAVNEREITVDQLKEKVKKRKEVVKRYEDQIDALRRKPQCINLILSLIHI